MSHNGNPFIGYGRIIHGDRLVGREDTIEELQPWLLNLDGGCFNIAGMPKVGKSSVLSALLTNVRTERPDWVVIRLNLEHYPARRLFYREALAMLRAELARLGVATPPLDEKHALEDPDFESYDDFRQTLIQAVEAKRDLDVILAIDELDHVCSWHNGAATLHEFRAFVQDYGLYRVRMAVISRRRLGVIETALTGVSTFSDMCHPHFLKPLEAQGVTEMIGRSALPCSDSDVELMTSHTGGHPYLAEMCLYHACYARSIATGTGRARAQILAFYRRTREFLELDSLFVPLLRTAARPRLQIPALDLEHLLQYGLIRPRPSPSGEDDGPIGWSEHFQLDLERCRREADANDDTLLLWRRTELAIREFIETILREALGQEWEQNLAATHPAVAQMLEGCRERAEREYRGFGFSERPRLLDYTYPQDLWLILSKAWPHFGPHVTGVSKEQLRQMFDKLIRVRNPVMHNRVVPPRAEDEARFACREVLDAINTSL